MDIKILGVGCPRCQELEKRVIDTPWQSCKLLPMWKR